MEKRVPHYKLTIIKDLLQAGKVQVTGSALSGGASMGFNFSEMLEVVENLEQKDFYKSMTTHADHKTWQDVYHPVTQYGEVYLKLTVIDKLLIVSFKEL